MIRHGHARAAAHYSALAAEIEAQIVGYHLEHGYVCTDAECLAFYPHAIGKPIFADEALDDEAGFFICDSCTEVLDKKAEAAWRSRAVHC